MKIAVLGFGSIGKRHASNLLNIGHTIFVYDPDDTSGRSVDSAEEAIDKSDAVVIASPSYQHWADLDLVIGNGKHVFVEKPIGVQKMTNGRCFEIARKNNLVVMVGNNLRFHSCVKQAKRWMEVIGNPIWASFTVSQYSDKPAYLRDGVWLNWLSHEADLALYFLGPARVTTATGDETIGDMCLLHESGARSTVHGDYLAPVERRGFCILGTNGNIGVDLVSRTAVLKLKVTPTFNSQSHFTGEDSYDQNYIDEMQAFVDRIEGKYALGATGAEGLACLEILLEARRMAGLT